MANELLLELVGERLARLRQTRGLTQDQLAEQAGLGLRSIQRLETGTRSMRLDGFIRVCRALGILERFELLLPEPSPSPMEELKLQGKTRKRMRVRNSSSGYKTQSNSSSKSKPDTPWTWGEES